jgi:hypothetical protein
LELKKAANWETLVEQFTREQGTLELEALLKQMVTIDFSSPTPLSAALKTLKAQGSGLLDEGAPVYVDPEGLKTAKATMETPITVPRVTCTLGDAFRYVLEPIGLDYSVKDGLIWITAKPRE